MQDNDAYNRFTGKTVLLADDITVTRIAGGSGHDFKGIFDGQGHTLTVAYGTADSPVSDDDKAAPFRNVESGCVIKNLHTQGTIYTSRKYAGGIVGTQYGTVKLENCRSSVTINSMTAGDGTHGGLVGYIGNSNSAKLTIDGCVVDGKILSVGDDPTTNCAGFVGYKGNNATFTITNSIYAPKALEADETEPAGNSATFVRNGSVGANCYYTRTLGTAQGKQAYTISAGENVTLALSGTAKTYTVSGITAYENNNGLLYGDKFYAGNGDSVSLTLGNTTPTGYAFAGYTVTAGTLEGTENPYTLTMPDSNVAVTAVVDVESYFNAGTLTLKGTVLNGDNGIVLPNGVNKEAVVEIVVDQSGATLPQDSSCLFDSFTNVTSIYLTGADTRNVTNIMGMFWSCSNLTELDLSSFDTSRVSDMNHMFASCLELKTIYVSEQWRTESVTYSNDMFQDCRSLTGGSGTVYDRTKTDKEYARIDKDGQPGYLTGVYTLTLPENMEIATDADEEYKVGSRYFENTDLTFKAKTGYGASNVKANGSELTADENGVYTITMPEGSVTVTADIVKYTPVVINYVDINGITTPTTVYKEIYSNGEYTLPGTPYLDGYDFTGWTVNGTSIKDKDYVIAEVGSRVSHGENVTISVVYTPRTDSHRVTVTGGTLQSPYSDEANFIPSTQLYATASPAPDGQKFDHWAVSYDNGTTWTTVGYNETYAFRMPTKDIQLKAVFVAESDIIKKEGTAYIESVTKTGEKINFIRCDIVRTRRRDNKQNRYCCLQRNRSERRTQGSDNRLCTLQEIQRHNLSELHNIQIYMDKEQYFN